MLCVWGSGVVRRGFASGMMVQQDINGHFSSFSGLLRHHPGSGPWNHSPAIEPERKLATC